MPLRGLTKRRERERALFDDGAASVVGTRDNLDDLSLEEIVTGIDLVKSGGRNFLFAFNEPSDNKPRTLYTGNKIR
jgi:hypothetical protein